MLKEEQIIKRLKAGDYNSIGLLMDLHQAFVYTLVFQMVKSKQVAEELTQDVFIKVFKKINSYQERSKFTTWLYTISYRTALNFLEKKQIVFSVSEMESANEEVADFIEIDTEFEKKYFSTQNEKQSILWRAIDQLPVEQGVIISLYYLQQLSVIEISDMLQKPQSSIKTQLFRGRKTLREILLKRYTQDELL